MNKLFKLFFFFYIALCGRLSASVNSPNETYDIDPFSVQYGSEYTSICYDLINEEISLIYKDDINALNNHYHKINEYISLLTLPERAKFVKKSRSISRELYRRERIKGIEKHIEYVNKNIGKIQSFNLYNILVEEAEDYNLELQKKVKEKRNNVIIDPTDKIIDTYMVDLVKSIYGEDLYESDIKRSGSLLLTRGRVPKAYLFSDGWRRIINFRKREANSNYYIIEIDYYTYPPMSNGKYPDTYFYVKKSDFDY